MILPHDANAEQEAVAAPKTCSLQGLSGERVDVTEPRVHTAMGRASANTFSLHIFLAGGAFFGRALSDQGWKKILRRKKRVWTATQELVGFFSSGRLFVWPNNAIHVKTETFRGNMGMLRAFCFGKENLQKPLRRMEYFSLVFYYCYFKISTVSFKNAMIFFYLRIIFFKIFVFFLIENAKVNGKYSYGQEMVGFH